VFGRLPIDAEIAEQRRATAEVILDYDFSFQERNNPGKMIA